MGSPFLTLFAGESHMIRVKVGVAFSPYGKTLATGSYDRKV
jgi:hypothetical protein